MNETRNSAITDSPSMYSPIDRSTPAFCHHVQVRTTGSTNDSPASRLRWIHCTTAPVDSTVAAAIEATPSSEPCFGRRLPKRMIRKKTIPGITGISQAFSRNHPAAIIARPRPPKPHFHKQIGAGLHRIACGNRDERGSSGCQPFISLSWSRAIERRLR